MLAWKRNLQASCSLNLRGLAPSGSRGRRLSGLGYPSAILIMECFIKFAMEIEVETREGIIKIDVENATGEELLNKLNLSPDSVIIIADGKPMPYKEKIKGRRVKIIRVASGG